MSAQNAPVSDSNSIIIASQEAIFTFTSGLTFAEYLDYLELESRQFLRRRYDIVRVDPETQLFLATYPSWLYLVIVVSEDTPDTRMILPIVQRMVECSARIDLRIVSDEVDLAALNQLLDEEIDLEEDLGEIELPLLLVFDEEWNFQTQWGPRPEAAEARLETWIAAHPTYETLLDENPESSEALDSLVADLTNQMRLWYNDDLTDACIGEIQALLETLISDESEE